MWSYGEKTVKRDERKRARAETVGRWAVARRPSVEGPSGFFDSGNPQRTRRPKGRGALSSSVDFRMRIPLFSPDFKRFTLKRTSNFRRFSGLLQLFRCTTARTRRKGGKQAARRSFAEPSSGPPQEARNVSENPLSTKPARPQCARNAALKHPKRRLEKNHGRHTCPKNINTHLPFLRLSRKDLFNVHLSATSSIGMSVGPCG